jgi:hypothetical protein
MGDLYFLVKDVLAVDLDSTEALTIPKGETIEFVAARPPDERLVDVVWRGKTLMIFHRDLLRSAGQSAS